MTFYLVIRSHIRHRCHMGPRCHQMASHAAGVDEAVGRPVLAAAAVCEDCLAKCINQEWSLMRFFSGYFAI